MSSWSAASGLLWFKDHAVLTVAHSQSRCHKLCVTELVIQEEFPILSSVLADPSSIPPEELPLSLRSPAQERHEPVGARPEETMEML